MSSRRSVRQLLVAVLLGVLVGGGLMAVTPAGAEVSNAVATNWKKIWKKNLKPLADKRYYTKAQSDAKYSTKAETAAGDAASNAATDSKLTNYYKKAEVDARSYTKAESDAKYALPTTLYRGTYVAAGTSAVEFDAQVNWNVTLVTAPTPHYIKPGDPMPAGCSGSAAAPNAEAGHLCIFESGSSNLTNRLVVNSVGNSGVVSPWGGYLYFTTGSASAWVRGSWAMRPGPVVASPRGAGAPDAPAKTGGATSVD